MINPADFKDGELNIALSQLYSFNEEEQLLKEQLNNYFLEFDDDKNGYLDRKELRLFLNNFFGTYHIRAPLTDEFVDATFRQIDKNHDNKIQPEELLTFAKQFIKKLVVQFENAVEMKNQSKDPIQKRGKWMGQAK